ncbi:MAG TPA: hypothetical protein VGM94_04800 [Galbitalea sp.]|jgi:hypothetical protein
MRRSTWTCISAAASGVLIFGLVGCGDTHEVGTLGELRVTGNVNVLSAHVSNGADTLGPFTAGGRIDFEVTCVGNGLVTVEITGPIDEKLGVGCTAKYGSKNDVNVSQASEYTAIVAQHSTFSIEVTAPKSTRWGLAVAASTR